MPGYGEADIIQELEKQVAALTTALEAAKRMMDGAGVIHCRDCSPDMEMQGVPCPGVNIGARLRTEQEMHAAWRKRAEEAEQSLLARDALAAATRKVVEAGKMLVNSVLDASGHMQDALADPTIVALRRE